jgi:hypothetical protein
MVAKLNLCDVSNMAPLSHNLPFRLRYGYQIGCVVSEPIELSNEGFICHCIWQVGIFTCCDGSCLSRREPYASPHLHLISPRNKRIKMHAIGFQKESRAPIFDS